MAVKPGEDNNVDITQLEHQESVETDEWEADTMDKEAEELLGKDGCGGESDGSEGFEGIGSLSSAGRDI